MAPVSGSRKVIPRDVSILGGLKDWTTDVDVVEEEDEEDDDEEVEVAAEPRTLSLVLLAILEVFRFIRLSTSKRKYQTLSICANNGNHVQKIKTSNILNNTF